MKLRIIVVVLLVLGLVVTATGCDGKPSNSDVERAVLEYIAKLQPTPYFGHPPPYHWAERVEVIEYGRPYTIQTFMGDYTYWPVMVYLIGGQQRQKVRAEVYKDEFGKWVAFIP